MSKPIIYFSHFISQRVQSCSKYTTQLYVDCSSSRGSPSLYPRSNWPERYGLPKNASLAKSGLCSRSCSENLKFRRINSRKYTEWSQAQHHTRHTPEDLCSHSYQLVPIWLLQQVANPSIDSARAGRPAFTGKYKKAATKLRLAGVITGNQPFTRAAMDGGPAGGGRPREEEDPIPAAPTATTNSPVAEPQQVVSAQAQASREYSAKQQQQQQHQRQQHQQQHHQQEQQQQQQSQQQQQQRKGAAMNRKRRHFNLGSSKSSQV